MLRNETMNAHETIAVQSHYGTKETNGLVNGHEYHAAVDQTRQYSLAEVKNAGGKITRVRLLTEVWPGVGRIADVSHIYATLPDGSTVPVRIGVDNGTALRALKGEFIEWAKREKVSAKHLGLLDEGNWSILY